MALTLSLRRGQDFYVGDVQVVMKRVHDTDPLFEIEVPSSGRRYEIDDSHKVDLKECPGVRIFAGDRPQLGIARVALEAPRSVIILRGDRYRAGPEAPEEKVERIMRRPEGEATMERLLPGSRFVDRNVRSRP